MIQVGKQKLRNGVALAPMAGLTDVPFRTLAWRMGAGYMVSEMVSSQPQLWDTGKSQLRRIPVPGASPEAVQIAGTDPVVMAASAQRHAEEGVQIIDINFGCPAKKVCRKAAGSALLADLALLAKIVSAVVAAVDIPVTVKTRTGLLPGDDVGIEAGRIAAECGAQMITMHARSRACRFKGPVDYQQVAQLKACVDVPVMVNGDITSAAHAKYALRQCHADGVMIGRGAIGQPWLFAELTGRPLPNMGQRWAMVIEHTAHMHEFYGPEPGMRIARKHVAAYLAQFGYASRVPEFMVLNTAQGQVDWLARAAEIQSIGDPRQAA